MEGNPQGWFQASLGSWRANDGCRAKSWGGGRWRWGHGVWNTSQQSKVWLLLALFCQTWKLEGTKCWRKKKHEPATGWLVEQLGKQGKANQSSFSAARCDQLVTFSWLDACGRWRWCSLGSWPNPSWASTFICCTQSGSSGKAAVGPYPKHLWSQGLASTTEVAQVNLKRHQEAWEGCWARCQSSSMQTFCASGGNPHWGEWFQNWKPKTQGNPQCCKILCKDVCCFGSWRQHGHSQQWL